MPIWIQYFLYAAGALTALGAAVTALGVIWTKVLRPLVRLITVAEEMVPLLQELTKEFKGTPHAFAVLDEIVDQFRTDSGSSLKDQVNRLEKAANEHTEAAESARQRATDDRAETTKLILSLDRLSVKLDQLSLRVDAGAATGARIEQHASAVADDLAAAHKRADEVAHGGDAGAAADASAQQTRQEKETNAVTPSTP